MIGMFVDYLSASYLWSIFTPLMLSLLAISALILEMTVYRRNPRGVGVFCLLGLAAILFMQWRLQILELPFGRMNEGLVFMGQYRLDRLGFFFNYLFMTAALVTVAFSLFFFQRSRDHRGEYYILVIIATIGMSMMAAAHDLLILFVALEIMSIAIYAVTGVEQRSLKSGEASIKYLLLGAFSSAVLLFGMALIYGMTGDLSYHVLSEAIYDLRMDSREPGASQLEFFTLMFGVLLLLSGLLFKVAAVPFHMWTPDVYEGAPTPISAFMATGVKVAAFVALLRLMLHAFSGLWGLDELYSALFVIAVLTMTLGNLAAISQRNLKRMLAYSSIAHTGYLLIGIIAIIASTRYVAFGSDIAMANAINASSSIIFYLVIYTLMNLGAFGVIVVVSREKAGGDELDDFSGLASKRPGLAAIMAILMLSLTGIPPLAGFTAKFFIFKAAIDANLYALAVIGVVNSVVSAYYYLRVLVVMYMSPEQKPFAEKSPRFSGAHLANVLMAAGVVLFGLFPQSLTSLVWRLIDISQILTIK